MGSAPSVLSMVSVTSARPSGGRPAVPAKMTSSILPPRRLLAPCSPITHASAPTTLDLPEPLGPTMQVMPCSRRRVVAEAKDLKPLMVRLLTYTSCSAPPCGDCGARLTVPAGAGAAGDLKDGTPVRGTGVTGVNGRPRPTA